MPSRRRRKLFEDGLILRIGPLRQAGLLLLGATSACDITIACGSHVRFDLRAVSVIDGSGDGRMAFQVTISSAPGRQNGEAITGRFEIVGHRAPWNDGRFVAFKCPRSGDLCRTLYMPPGETEWASYATWPRSGFSHACENQSDFQRLVGRSQKLRDKLLVASEWLDPPPPRAPRRRVARHSRLVAEINRLEGEVLPRLDRAVCESRLGSGYPQAG
jgi:hypothetical protein